MTGNRIYYARSSRQLILHFNKADATKRLCCTSIIFSFSPALPISGHEREKEIESSILYLIQAVK